jgi:hypothetical protein
MSDENIFNKLGSLFKTPEGGGLLSDKTAGTFFPYLGMAGGKAPSNRDLINAAILRGSLELLKPRQPGENLASQASRALQAGQEPLKTMAALKLQQRKATQAGQLGQASVVTQLKDDVQKGINAISKITGIEDVSKEYPVAISTLNQLALSRYNTTGDYFSTNKYITDLLTELNTNVTADKDKTLVFKDIESASPELVELVARMNASKQAGSTENNIIKKVRTVRD